MDFKDFNFDPRVNEGIEAMGYKSPTPIQISVIPIILDNKDVIATAQTGTGKTGAFLLPLIHKIITSTDKDFVIKAVIIAPTRELVQQIDQQLNGMSYFAGLSSIAIFGGGISAEWDRQKNAIIRGVDVIVATPGRLLSHLALGYVDMTKVQCLILDEADRMLDMGFQEDIMSIISHLPKKRQTLLFSATMPPDIRKLASKILQNPDTITLALSKPAEGVVQAVYPVSDAQKPALIKHLLANRDLKSVLVFSATKRNVKLIATQLKEGGINVKAIHSDLEQAERETVLLGFRNREVQVLVATDVMSRGIDVDGIDLVINYDVPQDAEDYVHRVGRTARAASSGLALTFVNAKESGAFRRIEQLIEQQIRKLPLPEFLGPAPAMSSSSSSSSSSGRNNSRAGGSKPGQRSKNNFRKRGPKPEQGKRENPASE